jgi:hypothetical protein
MGNLLCLTDIGCAEEIFVATDKRRPLMGLKSGIDRMP